MVAMWWLLAIRKKMAQESSHVTLANCGLRKPMISRGIANEAYAIWRYLTQSEPSPGKGRTWVVTYTI